MASLGAISRNTAIRGIGCLIEAGWLRRDTTPGGKNSYKLVSPENHPSGQWLPGEPPSDTVVSPENHQGKTVAKVVSPESHPLSLLEDAPDWLVELRRIPGWPHDPLIEQRLVDWEKANQITTNPLETATAIVSKWPGPKSRPYRDPIATFKNWRLRDGKGTIPGSHSDRGKYTRQRQIRG
jgi:hypothetical protein